MKDLMSALVSQGLITSEQLQDALDKQLGAKKPLQELLVEMGFITEDDLHKAVSEFFKVPFLGSDEAVEPSVLKLVPFEMARRFGVIPMRKEGQTLVLAMEDPTDLLVIDNIRAMSGLNVEPMLAQKAQILKLIGQYYHLSDSVYDLVKNAATDVDVRLENAGAAKALNIDSLAEETSPVIKMVTLIIGDALKLRASDIHVEPQESGVTVRYRIDGYLKNITSFPLDLHAHFVSRIKILANLDIAETRKPQDGRVKVSANDRTVDLRISIVPTFYGEKLAIRLLDPKEAKVSLDRIGFEKEELRRFTQALLKPQGMILVTGPTGSGKTSSLYAALNFIKSETKNIITIEDPIEYLIDGLNQIQLNPIKDVTFATSLRSVLRQDPNIIFIGEIRDRETADIAFRSSQTGHLVLSTLHTNNTPASITRLLDIGLEPYLIASSLLMVVAQRLVRTICPYCKEEYIPDLQQIAKFRAEIVYAHITKFYRGKGCQQCNFSGFLGRTAVFEIMEVNEALRTLIAAKSSEDQILHEAQFNGMRTLLDAGIAKVAAGITTIEEVLSVVGIKDEVQDVSKSVESGMALKILICDDDEDILKVVEKRLTSAGFQVVKARDGLEGLELAHKEKPGLIISDVTMPKMSGFELVKALRSKLETAATPIILLTARQDKGSELKGIDVGADDYITKPFDSDKLLARIKMLLRRK